MTSMELIPLSSRRATGTFGHRPQVAARLRRDTPQTTRATTAPALPEAG